MSKASRASVRSGVIASFTFLVGCASAPIAPDKARSSVDEPVNGKLRFPLPQKLSGLVSDDTIVRSWDIDQDGQADFVESYSKSTEGGSAAMDLNFDGKVDYVIPRRQPVR